MVKTQINSNSKSIANQGERGCPVKANKIEASTAYEYCKERLSPFGGLLGLEKFLAQRLNQEQKSNFGR